MVGGTTPPQSDSGEISRVLVLNLLWQSKRCSRTAQDISVLTTPSLLSRAPGYRHHRHLSKRESGNHEAGGIDGEVPQFLFDLLLLVVSRVWSPQSEFGPVRIMDSSERDGYQSAERTG